MPPPGDRPPRLPTVLAPSPAGRGLRIAAALLMVPSGAAALAHEAAWQRIWTPIAGAGVGTVSAVVAGTLLGLAAGAWAGGRIADRSRRPGLVFAAAEALGALLSLLVPWAAAAAGRAVEGAVSAGVSDGVLEASRTLAVALCCALPSAALGASLPALVRAAASSGKGAGPSVSSLYASNTAGAVVGLLLAAGFGFEALGNRGTVEMASVVQLATALLGAVLFMRRTDPAVEEGPAPGADAARAQRFAMALPAAAFLAGASGLAIEVAWTRRLTPALGTTTYAFATVLGAYLAATALGVACLGPRRARPAGSRPFLVCLLAAAPAALLAPLVLPVSVWASERLALLPGTALDFLWVRSAAAAAILVPSTLLGAAALPWLVHAANPRAADSGAATGRLFAANGLGAAVSAAATGLLWLPAVGSAAVLRGAGGLYALAALFVARSRPARAVAALCALAGLGSSAFAWNDDAGRDSVGATFDAGRTDPRSAPALWSHEGRVSTVVVRDREGRPELWVDGTIVASAEPTDRMHLALLGHLPMLLHPAPHRAAVVGLGTGITATAVAAHHPERLDVFELEPSVREAAEHFREVGGGLPPEATFRAIDGRDALNRAREPYDVITSDPIHPAVAGSSTLYTLEHYRVLAAHLAPGGVVCQWLPLYEMETGDIRLVLRTFSAVFHVAVFEAGPDLVMIGSVLPFAVDAEDLERRLQGPEGAGLARLGLRSAGRLLGLLVADPGRARRFAGDGPLNTDDRLLLEFASARSQYTGSASRNRMLLAAVPADPLALLRPGSSPDAAFRAGAARSKSLLRGFAGWIEGGMDDLDAAADTFELLADEDPTDGLSASMRDEAGLRLAQGLVGAGDASDAPRGAEVARKVLSRGHADVRQRLDAAGVLLDAGFPDEARAEAKRVLEVAPRSERARRLAEPAGRRE